MIDVMQTAKHRLPDDLPVARFADRRIDRARSALANRAMRAPAIEIHVCTETPSVLNQ
jgi:hypothetical protein